MRSALQYTVRHCIVLYKAVDSCICQFVTGCLLCHGIHTASSPSPSTPVSCRLCRALLHLSQHNPGLLSVANTAHLKKNEKEISPTAAFGAPSWKLLQSSCCVRLSESSHRQQIGFGTMNQFNHCCSPSHECLSNAKWGGH